MIDSMKKTVSLAATLFAISLGTLSSCHAPVPYGTDIDVAKKCAISIFSFDEDGKRDIAFPSRRKKTRKRFCLCIKTIFRKRSMTRSPMRRITSS